MRFDQIEMWWLKPKISASDVRNAIEEYCRQSAVGSLELFLEKIDDKSVISNKGDRFNGRKQCFRDNWVRAVYAFAKKSPDPAITLVAPILREGGASNDYNHGEVERILDDPYLSELGKRQAVVDYLLDKSFNLQIQSWRAFDAAKSKITNEIHHSVLASNFGTCLRYIRHIGNSFRIDFRR